MGRAGGREVTERLEVQVMTLGDVAIVGYPAELFNAYSRHVKAESPFPDTIVVTLANGSHGYVPTRQAFDHGGYEPRFASSSRLVPEAGDLLTDAALTLLQRQSKGA